MVSALAKLHRDAVIQTALELLNEVGEEGLTTRRLAERLGVQQPALYWHFKNKRVLLDALAETILAEHHDHALPRAGENWRHFLIENAHSFRRALLTYRDGAHIHAGTRPNNNQAGQAETQIEFLIQAGFTPANAARALIAISHYVVGSALEQQADIHESVPGDAVSITATSEIAQAIAILDADGAENLFDFGLMLLVDGLERHRQS
ncbi:transcriptional regulator, TetR family [Brucella anthropi ATCC 49188]|uniref:Transcriptional regulator, TetR family n=1 Tax=Brucella anthropi (strain ATCC 49188 / DSM 6882 / CCUG 24695 / JCM 21032 / LMG 3331 / NBRC 15819 / NCTC 12168 / Alc 37) TaxID=439375 RepID=A6X092_BRUA4|nr:transcriptional regulator, TetR family [Brucella anthropi ATCC 49188]